MNRHKGGKSAEETAGNKEKGNERIESAWAAKISSTLMQRSQKEAALLEWEPIFRLINRVGVT